MPKIRILSDRVANQIAAGEVIERPAAVIKELLENSIDAKASRIDIAFRNGGKSFMSIHDNGIGMSPDQAMLSLERHATSKLYAADDLLKITSFGFRGEALPSIASVSRFTLRSRAKENPCGTEILVNGGKLIHQKDHGMPEGTHIEIQHLFNSVPARRKFMKTDNTEAAHIIHLVRLYALAHPNIAFTLTENDRCLFRSPQNESLKDRIADIWNKNLAKDIIPVTAEDKDLKLYGLIGKPGISRATRQELITLVNNRPVDSRTLAYSIIESFHTFIPKGRYPVAFLFLDIDPAKVDVNVHPAKREIRFRDEGIIRQFVMRALLNTLQTFSETTSPIHQKINPIPLSKENTTPSIPQPVITPPPTPTKTSFQVKHPQQPTANTPTLPRVSPPKLQPNNFPKTTTPTAPLISTYQKPTPTPSHSSPTTEKPATLNWRYIGRLTNHKALFETDSGLVILNYRNAHQRIAFEKIEQSFINKKATVQLLLIPQPIELPPLITPILEDSIDFFKSIGLNIEPFGRNFYRIETTPDWMEPNTAAEFLQDTLAFIKEKGLNPTKKSIFFEEVARLASIKATRKDDNLSEDSIKALANTLMQCKQPLTCPRGHPTLIELTHNELDKRFGK